jgi:hypothetical protein
MRISTNLNVSSVVFRPKKLEIRKIIVKTVKEPEKILCQEIEPNTSKHRAMHEGDDPSFRDEFMKFTFFFTVLIIFRIFKEVPKYLATGL